MRHGGRSVGALALLALLTTAHAADWPDNSRLSGTAFLPPGLLALQNDTQNNPIALWLDKGQALWREAGNGGAACQSCHGTLATLRGTAASFPKIATDTGTLINLEDQILRCRQRSGQTGGKIEDDAVLALSAVLHDAARNTPIQLKAPVQQEAQWQIHLQRGAQLFSTRMGRINLACVHCHDQNIGKTMHSDVVSPAHPTGFPVYRMAWQRLGSVERRLRACYSGVHAVIPPPGDPALRDLELFLKVRASGMPLEGPTIRR